MFGSAILEIGIGLILVFLLFSLIVTATCEAVQLVMKTRARELERGLAEVFQDREDGTVRTAFYNHPLIYALYRGPYTARKFGPQGSADSTLTRLKDRGHSGRDLPSYIPTGQFATVLIDLWQSGQINAPVKTALAVLAQQSDGDPASIRAKIEAWYDAAMERTSGTFKRHAQQFSLAIGLVIAAALNLNALAIVEALSTNATLREAMVAVADDIVPDAEEQAPPADDAAPARLPVEAQALFDKIENAGVPMGWGPETPTLRTCVGEGKNRVCDYKIKVIVWMSFGWLIMALAGTLGAPFWFDLLSKFVTIRSTMKPQAAAPAQTPPPAPTSSAPADVTDESAVDLPSGPTPDNVSPYSYG